MAYVFHFILNYHNIFLLGAIYFIGLCHTCKYAISKYINTLSDSKYYLYVYVYRLSYLGLILCIYGYTVYFLLEMIRFSKYNM